MGVRVTAHLPRCLVVLLLGLTLLACGTDSDTPVGGVITELDAAGLTSVRRIVVRDDQGTTWDFAVDESSTDESGRPLNPSHLRDHMLGGERVVVAFHRQGNTLIAHQVSH